MFDLLKIKNEKKLLTKSEKKSKIFCDLLAQNGIDKAVGYEIYFLRLEILCLQKLKKSETAINNLIFDTLEKKHISIDLAKKIEKIIIEIEKNFNEEDT